MNICILGNGKMGSAIARALQSSYSVTLCGKEDDQSQAIAQADMVIFAVKPQDFEDCVIPIKDLLTDKMILSIMAGINMDKLEEKTGSLKIIRSMPNLPLQVGLGVTGWLANPEVENHEEIDRLMQHFGTSIELEEEDEIDAITALSGSGPAYFFYLCELLQENAEELGFSEEDARDIAEKTFLGAAELLKQNKLSAKEWREAVTSKGGTTHAAIDWLQTMQWDEDFQRAIDAAHLRSKELNQDSQDS